MNINELFSIITAILLIVLILFSIILVYKLIKTLIKLDRVVEDINTKAKKLNGLFDVVDNATDALSSISDKMVLLVSSGITSLISKFRKKGEDSDEK